MHAHDKMKALYEQHKGKEIETDKYKGVVSGFHFAWDDGDGNCLIIAITENKNGLGNGIRYFLSGDVHVTHKCNQLGYDFIHVSDLEHGYIKEQLLDPLNKLIKIPFKRYSNPFTP